MPSRRHSNETTALVVFQTFRCVEREREIAREKEGGGVRKGGREKRNGREKEGESE